ncbi:hypothetical protein MMC13_007812 [Lambiella insularis]|nr:hypothetical protein [Lambiella insularis]
MSGPPQPLIDACISGSLRTVQQHLSTLPSSSQHAFTEPLAILAAEHNRLSVFQYLLSVYTAPQLGDIRMAVVTYEGDALTNAVDDDHTALVDYLLAHGARINNYFWADRYPTLALAASKASTETAGVLLKHGAQLKQSLALQLAAAAGREEMMAYLVERGASVNESPEKDGTIGVLAEGELGTALHYAAEAREMGAVRFCWEKGQMRG